MREDARPQYALAVISDAHFHEIEGDYGIAGIKAGNRRLTLQTWAHSRESTRVYNESAPALMAALDEVAARGIRHVVLLGDYTDDGQRETTHRLAQRLSDYETRFGTRFYALPGNHDLFGPSGRHQSRYFLRPDGSSIRVTSDDRDSAPDSVVSAAMFCEGYPDGLAPMARHGYFRRPDDLFWETPFGTDDRPERRTYEVVSEDGLNRYRLMDASYLVEPEPGLWLLMLDANVFEPRNGTFRPGSKRAFIDSTAAGWNAVLRLKPFLLAWISDVTARAKASGKTLLAFSHYPAIDPLEDQEGFEQALFPSSPVNVRRPRTDVAEALMAAGLSLHFSGHWHVDGISEHRIGEHRLTNIALPSPVAFPPAFKLITAEAGRATVAPVELSQLPLDQEIMELYRLEVRANGLSYDEALSASDYGSFLHHHVRSLVVHRYLPREWPKDVVETISSMSLADLCSDPRTARPMEAKAIPDAWRHIPVIDLIADWYCLRQAGTLGKRLIGPQALDRMRAIATVFVDAQHGAERGATAAYLNVFFRSMLFYVKRAERLSETNFFEF
ncbi:metallophosphoesterase family protein [Rhizobium glycinendophyticum]|uniref:Metallophosphoesterase n=1 Tax=Rhizobium glycinendophyticum TaxID=2589807 RepID=A0A504UEX6_9HYPH|nr:metallophosphoesterase [Rhizobium glycinendophyticum]TPP09325.1 metallophosphoesterase [Rhizobium glycinendophyticum]